MRTFKFINKLTQFVNDEGNLITSVGKNENKYVIGSGVGSQSRFVRSALKIKSSSKGCGVICEKK
tara:strand:- start:55 stop:249 length:195 start_codon:yes stop_codon:yes gene_type:complete